MSKSTTVPLTTADAIKTAFTMDQAHHIARAIVDTRHLVALVLR